MAIGKSFRAALLSCFISAGTSSFIKAQDGQIPDPRFVTDVLLPLFNGTDAILERNGRSGIKRLLDVQWNEPRPEPLARSKRCYALKAWAEEYDRLGLMRNYSAEYILSTTAKLYQPPSKGIKIGEDLIRAIMERCRSEAEYACRVEGNPAAVKEAVRTMAWIREFFYGLDMPREHPFQSFPRILGDDDISWMKKTLAQCTRFDITVKLSMKGMMPVQSGAKYDVASSAKISLRYDPSQDPKEIYDAAMFARDMEMNGEAPHVILKSDSVFPIIKGWMTNGRSAAPMKARVVMTPPSFIRDDDTASDARLEIDIGSITYSYKGFIAVEDDDSLIQLVTNCQKKTLSVPLTGTVKDKREGKLEGSGRECPGWDSPWRHSWSIKTEMQKSE